VGWQIRVLPLGIEQMSRLRDICLQVRCDGSAQFLVERFFAPAAQATILHKARVAALTKEALLPIALATAEILARRAKTQILIAISPNTVSAEADSVLPTNSELELELLHRLSEIPTNAEGQQALPYECLEVRVCALNEQYELVGGPVCEVH